MGPPRQVGAMKPLHLFLFLILLGTRMQTVKVVEEEISIRLEMDRMIENFHLPHADSSNRWKRMKFCEREWKEIGDWQEKEGRTSLGKDPRTFEENSQGRDPRTPEQTDRDRDPRTCEENSQGKDPSTFDTMWSTLQALQEDVSV